jgi:hypothetical protein
LTKTADNQAERKSRTALSLPLFLYLLYRLLIQATVIPHSRNIPIRHRPIKAHIITFVRGISTARSNSEVVELAPYEFTGQQAVDGITKM